MDLCVQLGTDVFAGPMYSAVGKRRLLPPPQRQKEWDRAIANLRKACDLAAKRSVRLAIEPLNRFETSFFNTAAQVREVVDRLDHPAVGMLLDTFHMNIEEKNQAKAIKKEISKAQVA